MNIAELLKIKTAAKAWLGLLAVAAQVALTYLPDHSGYYTAVQALVGILSVIGIYAVPNKVAEAKDAVTSVTNVFNAAVPTADVAQATSGTVQLTPIQKDTP